MVRPIIEKVKCPFCGKGEIELFTIPSHYDMTTSRISSGSAKIPRFNEERMEVSGNCPVCGKKKKEIEEAIKKGQNKEMSHEEMISRIKKSGLPTKLEF